jgi:hypothetical protein
MLTSLTKQTDRLMSFMKLILKVSIGAARLKGKQAAGSSSVHCCREFIRTRSLFHLSKNISTEVDREMALISSSIKAGLTYQILCQFFQAIFLAPKRTMD